MGAIYIKALAIAFAIIFAVFTAYGGWSAVTGNSIGIVVAVFGTIGLLNAVADFRHTRGQTLAPKVRIAAHLSRMLGGTIAAVTAFLLIQLDTNSIIVWLAPTAVLTPLIVLWSAKVRGGWMPRSPLKGARPL